VAAGQVIHRTIDETRTAADFANHIRQTASVDPDAEWIFVLDNVNTQMGAPIVCAVADMLGIDEAELGNQKSERGSLARLPRDESSLKIRPSEFDSFSP